MGTKSGALVPVAGILPAPQATRPLDCYREGELVEVTVTSLDAWYQHVVLMEVLSVESEQ